MTVYTADPIPMKAVSGAQAFETADTINKPLHVSRPISLNFDWAPTSPAITMIGLDTVTVRTVELFTPITFTATVLLPPNRYAANYEWKMGDGSIYQTSIPVITHEYTVPNYSGVRVSLIVTDDLGVSYSCGHQVYLFGSIFSAGGIIFGGHVTEHNTHAPHRSGAVIFGGHAVESSGHSDTRTGDIILGGTIVEHHGVALTGDIILGGTITEHWSTSALLTGDLIFSNGALTGDLLMGGHVVESWSTTTSLTGDLVLSGADPVLLTGSLTFSGYLMPTHPNGTLILGGSLVEHAVANPRTGNIILGGHL
jgi:hypothetical protein